VAYARARADFVAFLDDDEVPAPGWLEELLRVQIAFSADIVTGPVLSNFEAPVPRWLAEEPFFTRPRFRTGTRLGVARTGNVLIRSAVLRSDQPFDERFALSGGEDTLLFLQLANAGHVIVWADEAEVWESVPPSRTTVRWVMQRAFQSGNCWSLCEVEVRPSPITRGLRLAKGLTRVLQGVFLLPGVLVFGRGAGLKALRYLCIGAGNVTGALGVRLQRYPASNGRHHKGKVVG
jgi:hypothetical protein